MPPLTPLRRIFTCTLIAIVATLAATAAQKPAVDTQLRSQAFGELRSLDDKPWVGARVTLISNRSWVATDADLIDKLSVTTDQRGRFRAPVLRNHRYSIFATALLPKHEDDGKSVERWRMTEVHEDLVAGAPVILRESKHRGLSRSLRLNGIDAWVELGPVRLRAYPLMHNRTVETVLVADDGTATLPPQVAQNSRLELVAKNGMVLWTDDYDASAWDSPSPKQIQVKPPRTVRVAIRSIATGQGIPAATIFASSTVRKKTPTGYTRLSTRLAPIAKTDASGVGEFVLSAVSMKLFVGGEGLRTARLRPGDARMVKNKTWKPLVDGKHIDFHANLVPGQGYEGRILLAPGRPARRLAIQLTGMFYRVIHTDDAGRFEINGCPVVAGTGLRCDLLLSPTHAAELPTAWQKLIQFQIDEFVTLPGKAKMGTRDLGDFDLSAFCPVQLTVVTPSNQPADGARVWVASRTAVTTRTNQHGHLADRSGRAILLLASGWTHTLVVEHESGTMIQRISTTGSATDERVVPLRIQLKETLRISGTIKSAKNAAVPSLRLFHSRGGGFARRRAVAVTRATDSSSGKLVRNHLEPEEVQPHELLDICNRHRLFAKSTLTDKSGRFSIRVPNVPAQYHLFGSRKVLGLFSQQVSDWVEIDDKSVEVKLTAK